MAVRSKPEQKAEWKPSMADVQKLSDGMKQFSTIEIDCHTEKKSYKKKLYPFEQYAMSQNVIKIKSDGQISVVSPFNWKNLCETYDLLKWKTEKDQDAFLQAYPEEREVYEQKVASLIEDISSMFKTT